MQINPNPDTVSEGHRFREVAQLLGTALHRWHQLRGDKRTRAIASAESDDPHARLDAPTRDKA